MGKKAFLMLAGFVGVLALTVWAYPSYTAANDARQVLVDRLAATSVPSELQLVAEWSSDGTLLSAGRPRAAARAYVFEGDTAAACSLVDRFYAEAGVGLRRFDPGGDGCARSIRGQNITIWVETIKSFTLVPDEYKDRPELVTVRYSAF